MPFEMPLENVIREVRALILPNKQRHEYEAREYSRYRGMSQREIDFAMEASRLLAPMQPIMHRVLDGGMRVAVAAIMRNDKDRAAFSNVSHIQHSHIARAVFIKFRRVEGPTHDVIENLIRKPLNKKRRAQALAKTSDAFATALIHGFYNQNRHGTYWSFFRVVRTSIPDYEAATRYVDYIAELYYDAIGYSYKQSLGGNYRTSTVMNMLKSIRQTENFGIMPILADALAEADWDEPALLEHLRESRVFSTGSWIFRSAGMP